MTQTTIAILGSGMITPFGEQAAALPETLPADRPATSDLSGLDRFIPKRSLRRIDRFSRLGLYAACLALEDAGLWGEDVSDAGLAVASGYGAAQTTFAFLDSFLDSTDKLASPTHFSNGLHNASPAYISMLLNIGGPSSCISNVGLGPAYALLSAMHWLRKGLVRYVLVGGVDEYCQVADHCHARFRDMPEGSPLVPESFLGEGAAFVVLGGVSPADAAGTGCACELAQVQVGKDAELAPREDASVFAASMGDREHEARYAELLRGRPAVSTLPSLGSHPSALMFSVVQAYRTVLQHRSDAASALVLGRQGVAARVDLAAL